jgi:hypothetical protein
MRSSFANPNDATPYSYEEFPASEKKGIEFTVAEGVVVGEFNDYMEYQNGPHEDLIPVVQPAILQDFKEVLAPPQS